MNGFLHNLMGPGMDWFFRGSIWWEIIGYGGNALFTSRFLVQWLYSERHKRVVVPPIFWHLSLWGSLVSLIYALHADRGPIILSFLLLPILYGRNLMLLYRKPGPDAPKEEELPAGKSPT